ncbi:hypothetical protein [Streptomyces sp. Da 82-17]|uniref:hypothetical protein n=1 Tax=Streptomyces sp. Da 82-17 TaxID=3377116 RepID=UPI0038D4A148
MPTPPPGAGDEQALHDLAEQLELAYAAEHLTLADPRTATAHTVAMHIAMTVMDGAHAQGLIDAAQRLQLTGLLEGARRAGELAEKS